MLARQQFLCSLVIFLGFPQQACRERNAAVAGITAPGKSRVAAATGSRGPQHTERGGGVGCFRLTGCLPKTLTNRKTAAAKALLVCMCVSTTVCGIFHGGGLGSASTATAMLSKVKACPLVQEDSCMVDACRRYPCGRLVALRWVQFLCCT